jgi:ribosomal-protein-alanine N-acetyltransferase
MNVLTERIEVVPLDLNELKTIIKSRAEFEKMARCQVSGLELPSAYCEELAEMLEQTPHVWNNKTSDYLFYTLWTMIDRKNECIVGQFTFNGKPTPEGEVEVFFSIEPPYRRKGYATEVMQGIIEWAKEANLFKTILIEADLNNKAAMASLKKLGFKPIPADEENQGLNTLTKYYIKVNKKTNTENDVLDFD